MNRVTILKTSTQSMIGDRSIKEDYGKIQKDRQQEMKYWSDKFRTAQKDEKELKVGIVAANNHYTGFGATSQCV